MTAETAIVSRQQAEEWKNAANEEYKKQKYDEAIELYGRAIGMSETLSLTGTMFGKTPLL